ncbi:MAG: RDD family protein [Planctomycetota bacterium]
MDNDFQDDLEHNPYAAPSRPAEHGGPPQRKRLATPGQRIIAKLVDSLLPSLIWIGVFMIDSEGAAQAIEAYSRGETSLPLPEKATLFTGLAGLAFVLMQLWLVVTDSQTIGKRIMGIRVHKLNGPRAGAGRYILQRALLGGLPYWIPFVGIVAWLVSTAMLLRPDRRTLHDFIGGTEVLRA